MYYWQPGWEAYWAHRPREKVYCGNCGGMVYKDRLPKKNFTCECGFKFKALEQESQAAQKRKARLDSSQQETPVRKVILRSGSEARSMASVSPSPDREQPEQSLIDSLLRPLIDQKIQGPEALEAVQQYVEQVSPSKKGPADPPKHQVLAQASAKVRTRQARPSSNLLFILLISEDIEVQWLGDLCHGPRPVARVGGRWICLIR